MDRFLNKYLLVFAALLVLSSNTFAQSAAKYTLTAIRFTGLHRYAPEQGIAGSGLRIGGSVGLSDLQSAADRLSKTGAFDSVSFQYSMRGNDIVAQFGVTETKNVLPCMFDNFAWFSDADLDRTLRKNVTYYIGDAPVAGGSVEEIRTALQDLLHANGISGEVSELPYGTSGKLEALLFHIDGISQPIKAISFSGEAAVSDKQLADASSGLLNQDFSYTNVATYASSGLLPLYYRRGYLRSQFGRAKVSLMDASSKGPVADVSIALAVTEGNQYSWSGVSWSGNHVLSADELGKALGINPQEVANQEKIDAGFANAQKAYLARGYISVRLTPARSLDDEAKLARYSVQIEEGSQFHMGQVHFDGLPDRTAAALLKKWKLKTGDIYDATYPPDFLKNTAGKELGQQGINYHSSNLKEESDPDTLTVNVRIQFH
jgi:outer membrane protein insertion porin family